MADGKREDLRAVETALKAGDTTTAGNMVDAILMDNPEDPEALLLLCRTLIDTDKPAVAYPVARELTRRLPNRWEPWYLLGAAEVFMQRTGQARKALFKAMAVKKNAATTRILANALVLDYDFEGAERYATESLNMEESWEARIVLAFAQLHQRRWTEGWKNYRCQLGQVPDRTAQNYGLPEWQGQKGRVLVYGEQGLGDQIAFCSALKPHQLVCHPKLKNLFSHSFENVYGDQFTDEIDWQVDADYQTSMASAMQYVEMKPRGRYLSPNWDKRVQWKALLNSVSFKPKVGIAWTGGRVRSHGWRGRNLELEDLLPILKLPFTFVSLEYKDRRIETEAFEERYGVRICEWPWGTQTEDYDDTAALIDNLDAVVCVPTTAYHMAGALGVPAHVIVHDRPHWHEGTQGESPWWESVKFYRRPELGTEGAIKQVAEQLKQDLCGSSGMASSSRQSATEPSLDSATLAGSTT